MNFREYDRIKFEISTLEGALVDFLVNGQRHAFLIGMCERVAALLRGPETAELSRQIADLRARIEGAGESSAQPVVEENAPFSPLLPGCEVCAQLVGATFNYIAAYHARLGSSAHMRDDPAAHRGFCRPHERQFEAIAASREVAVELAPVLANQAKQLRRIAMTNPTSEQAGVIVADLIPTGRTCPVCATARETEKREIGKLAMLVANQGPAAVLRRSALCTPHLAQLILAVRDPVNVQKLLLRHAELLERLEEDARRFALKYDAIMRYAASKEELAVANRAARVVLDNPSAQYEPESGHTP